MMVFEAGWLREFDKPAVVLREQGGLLAQLVEDAQSMASEVRKWPCSGGDDGGGVRAKG